MPAVLIHLMVLLVNKVRGHTRTISAPNADVLVHIGAELLIVNITGALLLGILLEALAVRGPDRGGRRRLRLLLGTGVLGGYTTYSLLAADVAGLLLDGRIAVALGYGVGSIVLGILAAWAGILLARGLGRRTGGRAT